MKKGEIGVLGEEIACRYLKKRGFTLVERNYRRPWGEIDVVARRGEVMHFVEVKAVLISRENISREMRVDPLEHVTRTKLEKVARTATSYMNSKGNGAQMQIDVIGVYLDERTRRARCVYLEQVIE